jgi:hypothetical protein
MTLVGLWYLRNRRLHRRKIDRLLSFARSEDYHHHRRFRAEH